MVNPYKCQNGLYTDRIKYFRYRYAYYRYKLNHDNCIKYAEGSNPQMRKKILGDLVQVRPNRKPHCNNMSITYTPLSDSNYNSYDKNNIINEDKFYIYYNDKVWSKCVDDYLKIQESSKRKYVMVRDVNNNNKPYAYTIS